MPRVFLFYTPNTAGRSGKVFDKYKTKEQFEPLVAQRENARRQKNYALADQLRLRLLALGITVAGGQRDAKLGEVCFVFLDCEDIAITLKMEDCTSLTFEHNIPIA